MQGRGGRGGRMPTGRGAMMQGRGGLGGRFPGRGNGGRMMMPSQGRGGRMMMPGRGRGGRMMLQGLGGRGRGSHQKIPSKLDVFNRYIGFKISGFLDRDDHENLGLAFPQFTPAPLTPEQQKMRIMKKMAENKMELKNPYGIEEDDENIEEGAGNVVDDANPREDTGILETSKVLANTCDSGTMTMRDGSENSKSDSTERKEVSEPDSPCQDGGEEDCDKKDGQNNSTSSEEEGLSSDKPLKNDDDNLDLEKKKEMMKEREEALRINMTDCHTLLAQLNTKRLYRRVKFFKRMDPNYDVDKAYPYNKDTVQISEVEWEALIEDYKERRIEMQKNKAIANSERVEKGKDRANRPRKMKGKKKKKKRGKGKKSEKSKRVSPEVVDETVATDAEEVEENTNEAKASDVENEKDSDDDVTESISDSDDESIDDIDFVYVGDKPSKYELLMFTPCPRAVAVLASYPRSGNSLMRNLYEKITLRVTGSDMMGGLQKHDLVGEMATGTNNVQFVKTHYPERMGHPPFQVSRAVLLVRNPYDAMDSYFNLMSTSTHTTSLTVEDRKKYAILFGEMAKKEILVWRDFHEYWLKQKIPLMVVRYEDLIRDTVRVVSKVIKFVLEINSMTFFEDRIQRAIGEEQVEKLGPYKARSGGIGKSLTKGNYTPQLLNQINYGIVNTMEKFGYKEMLIPNPSSWKVRPLDQWGVFIPGTSNEPMIINQKGLVRGPNRQTNWRMVKMVMEKDKQQKKECNKEALPEKVDLL